MSTTKGVPAVSEVKTSLLVPCFDAVTLANLLPKAVFISITSLSVISSAVSVAVEVYK